MIHFSVYEIKEALLTLFSLLAHDHKSVPVCMAAWQYVTTSCCARARRRSEVICDWFLISSFVE